MQNRKGPRRKKIPPTQDFELQVTQCLVRATLSSPPGEMDFFLKQKYLLHCCFFVAMGWIKCCLSLSPLRSNLPLFTWFSLPCWQVCSWDPSWFDTGRNWAFSLKSEIHNYIISVYYYKSTVKHSKKSLKLAQADSLCCAEWLINPASSQ